MSLMNAAGSIATLQWQNFDGTAHYKTTDGKNFTCNIPEEEQTEIPEPGQTQIPTTPGDNISQSVNLTLINSLDEIKLKLEKIDEMIQAIFRDTVDKQLRKSEVEKEY